MSIQEFEAAYAKLEEQLQAAAKAKAKANAKAKWLQWWTTIIRNDRDHYGLAVFSSFQSDGLKMPRDGTSIEQANYCYLLKD